jgi:hypothetical protein
MVMALALVLALAVWTPAQADTIGVSYRGLEGVSYRAGGQAYNVGTAEFYSIAPYQGVDWIGYCMDPTQYFGSPLAVVLPGSWAGPAYGSANWLEAAWLMENFAPGFSWLGNHQSINYGQQSVMDRIQAVQLAIWEVIVDPRATYGSSSLSQGNFTSATGSNLALASSFLTALSQAKLAGGGTVHLSGQNTFIVGQDPSHQDLLFGAQATIPEPGTMILVASGLGLLAWRRRRGGRPDPAC